MLRFLRCLAVFGTGCLAYGVIEVTARGFSHISMGILGGLAMLLIHYLNGLKKSPLKIFLSLVISSCFITLGEFITGEIVNIRLGLNIWDYSMLPLNFRGQICLPFTLLWFALSSVGMAVDDFLRIRLFYDKSRWDRIKAFLLPEKSSRKTA